MATEVRKLGRSGIEISPMGMGCWAIGGSVWGGGADDEQSILGIRRALDMGVTFFDTADTYGDGHSERTLAEGIRGHRAQVVIATKFAWMRDEVTGELTGGNPESIPRACEASLKRLETDYIDLYQFHLGGFELDKAVAVRAALEKLVAEGKIRAYGWSTDDAERAELFAQGEHCSAVQAELNVVDDAPDVLAVCDEYDLAAINRGPLAMGLLTGKYKPGDKLPEDDIRGPKAPGWMKYFKEGQPNPEWLEKIDAVRQVLTSNGRTLAQGAIAWLWARNPHNIPIPGFRNEAQAAENCGAMEFGPLTSQQMAEIETILNR